MKDGYLWIISGFIYPLTEGRRRFLAHNNAMVDFRRGKINLQFYFFKRFKPADIVNVDNILPVGSEKTVSTVFSCGGPEDLKQGVV